MLASFMSKFQHWSSAASVGKYQRAPEDQFVDLIQQSGRAAKKTKRRGARMRQWSLALALFSCLPFWCNAKDGHPPRWQINLKEKYGFESFDRTLVSTWTRQQDVVFLSSERVAVYQVSRSHETVKLSTRDASGGGGNYSMTVYILDARDGREIKHLRFPTNPEYSKVIATHDGKFLVRTGDVLYLYSADFERLASKNLPLKRKVIEEVWQIGVSPSGEEVVLVHQQVYHRNQLTAESVVDSADADVEILNADTLESKKTFSLLWFLHAWTAGENFLVSSAPQPSPNTGTFGLLNFEGKWSALKPDWYSEKTPCSYQMDALDHQLLVAYGCGNLSVFPQSGEKILSLKAGSKELVGSVTGAGDRMAVLFERRVMMTATSGNVPIFVNQPSHIDVFELKTKDRELSTAIHGNRAYYAVSAQGGLAVVNGAVLEVFLHER